jgi:hypothetical protein
VSSSSMPACGVALGADGLEEAQPGLLRPTDVRVRRHHCAELPLDERAALQISQWFEVLMAPAFSQALEVFKSRCASAADRGCRRWRTNSNAETSNASDQAC